MLRSNHLQPGINLNPISFPSADLTLKVFELTIACTQYYLFIYVTNKEYEVSKNPICVFLCSPFLFRGNSNMYIIFKCFFFFRWNQLARRGRTPSPSLSRALLAEGLQVLSLPAVLAHPVASATVLLEAFPCLRCLWLQ